MVIPLQSWYLLIVYLNAHMHHGNFAYSEAFKIARKNHSIDNSVRHSLNTQTIRTLNSIHAIYSHAFQPRTSEAPSSKITQKLYRSAIQSSHGSPRPKHMRHRIYYWGSIVQIYILKLIFYFRHDLPDLPRRRQRRLTGQVE